MIRVLVAEDSPTALAVLKKIIGSVPDMEVVGEARDGRQAVRLAAALSPDVITMDIIMPVLDGASATRRIMASTPSPIVAVTAYDVREMGASFDVLAAGALDIIRKPTLMGISEEAMAGDLITAIRNASRIKVFRRTGPAVCADPKPPSPSPPRRARTILLIGGSAGAPGVLAAILGVLPADFPAPIVVVQHIAPHFLDSFVRWLDARTRLSVEIAEEGLIPRNGRVYFPPVDRHLEFSADGSIHLGESAPVRHHRPSIDVLLLSAARVFGDGAVALLLSGMGSDGVEGAVRIRETDGLVMVQDPAEALVGGIPSAVVEAGAAHLILGHADAAWRLLKIFGGKEGGA